MTVTLARHPATPCPAVSAVAVEVAREADGGLTLVYRVLGDAAALRVPAPADAARSDGLWRHTCFEAFVMAQPGSGYREFNFAPSSRWAAYRFAAYRDGAADLAMPAPIVASRMVAGRLELSARLPGATLPPGPARLGLTAVLEDRAGDLSYWALRHPPGKPDFHHTEAFALVLPPP